MEMSVRIRSPSCPKRQAGTVTFESVTPPSGSSGSPSGFPADALSCHFLRRRWTDAERGEDEDAHGRDQARAANMRAMLSRYPASWMRKARPEPMPPVPATSSATTAPIRLRPPAIFSPPRK
jgi:hypothetical protein